MQIAAILFLLFMLFSFGGWCAEVLVTAIMRKTYINKGAMLGPVVPLYGVMAMAIFLFLEPHRNGPVQFLIGSVIVCATVELLAGVILEHIFRTRWWDYSKSRFHLKGYICLESSLAKGVLVGLAVKYLAPLLLKGLEWLPDIVVNLLAVGSFAVFVVDCLALLMGLHQMRKKWKLSGTIATALQKTSQQLEQNLTQKAEGWQDKLHKKHLQKAFPSLQKPTAFEEAPAVFAKGLGFYKLFWLFLIGSLVGDIIETIFVYATSGVLMSRSSLLYGPLSVVWGLGCVLLTIVLYGLREKSDRYIFIGGALLGGVYEYMCSVITEKAFGKVFWDYSAIPFNLNGRINLLYCIFWGALAVIWIKEIYPRMEKLIEKIPMAIGKRLTWILVLLLLVDGILTCMALYRLQQREQGQPATSSIEVLLDQWYPDDYLYHRYQNML